MKSNQDYCCRDVLQGLVLSEHQDLLLINKTMS